MFKIAIERDLDITKKRKTKEETTGFQLAEKKVKYGEKKTNQETKYQTEQTTFSKTIINKNTQKVHDVKIKLNNLGKQQDQFKKLA